MSSLFFQKTFRIPGTGIEWNSNINKIFGNIVGWKRVIAVDPASVNMLQSKVALSATSFYMYAGKGGNIL